MATTIQNLQVTFDVQGEGDEAVFARLFARHIEAWGRRRAEEAQRRRALETERALGDQPAGGGVDS
jgi:hypothetical protein